MRQAQQEETKLFDPKCSFNMALWFINVVTAAIYPFIRSGQGTRPLGKEGVLAFLALPIYASFAHSEAMLTYWYAWMLTVCIRKLFPDRRQHTLYQGWPWLTSWLTLGRLGEGGLRFVEPLVVFGLAYLARGTSLPLARFLSVGAFAIAMHNRIGIEMRQREKDAIHNARVEASRYL